MRSLVLAVLMGCCLLAGAEDTLFQKIVAKERQGLDSLKAGNYQEFAGLTADDAVLVDNHGPADKAQVVHNVSEFRLTDYQMSDIKFVRVSATSGLIVYTMTETGTSHGKEFTAHVYVSSLWAERRGKWVCVFSQETAAK
jgi:hypothetical protein